MHLHLHLLTYWGGVGAVKGREGPGWGAAQGNAVEEVAVALEMDDGGAPLFHG